jgi:hypothetical protein
MHNMPPGASIAHGNDETIFMTTMNPRLPLLSAILLLLTIAAAHAQEEIVSFDLKTPFLEKPDLAPAKNGALLLLLESDWGSVTEFGEDYALWLRGIERERRGDSIAVTLDLELRTGSLFGEGDLLASRKVAVTFHARDDWKLHANNTVVSIVMTGETCIALAAAVGHAVYPAATSIAERVVANLELLMPGDYEAMKLEAMVVGGEVVRGAREMVREQGER